MRRKAILTSFADGVLEGIAAQLRKGKVMITEPKLRRSADDTLQNLRRLSKPMIQKVTNARSQTNEQISTNLNDHELVDLENAIERELKRRAGWAKSHHVLCRLLHH